jgi:hypothetical protein
MSVLEFSRVYSAAGSVESVDGVPVPPLLPVTHPDLPDCVKSPYRVSSETHPNLSLQFQNMHSFINSGKAFEVRNVELVGRVNSLNAVNAVLSADLIRAKRSNLIAYILLSCSSLMYLLTHFLR